MKKRLALVAIFIAGLASPIALSSASASSSHLANPCTTTAAGYVQANLSWGVECLHAGEFCKTGNVEYHAYGFDCPAGRLTSYSGSSPSSPPPTTTTPTPVTTTTPMTTTAGSPLVPINGSLLGLANGQSFEVWTLCFPSYGSTLASGVVDWGDGSSTNVGSSGSGVTHAYSNGGSYTVTLTCKDAAGYTWSKTANATLTGPSKPSPAPVSTTTTAAPVPVATTTGTSPIGGNASTCSAGYVSANLPWGHKCLRAGEFCKIGNSAYIRYGFTCPASGHLRRR